MLGHFFDINNMCTGQTQQAIIHHSHAVIGYYTPGINYYNKALSFTL